MHLMIYTAYLLPMEHRPAPPAAVRDEPATALERLPEPGGLERTRRWLGAALTRMRPRLPGAGDPTASGEGIGGAALPET